MPITLPNLDDREFADLVAEAKSMIPQLAPSWTDHNPSDPGITLIELFAYICEMLIYRTNRITDANKQVFLELLMGSVWLAAHSSQSLDQQIAIAIIELRTEERAISNGDFETYALQADSRVTRAYCRPLKNYESPVAGGIYVNIPAHVSLVIVSVDDPFNEAALVKKNLAKIVTAFLEPRLLLTTQLHVVPASFLKLGVNLSLTIFEDYKEEDVRTKAFDELNKFFSPLEGGPDGQGWKPGQPVYLADIYMLLDQMRGIDFIEPDPTNPLSGDVGTTLDKITEGGGKMVGIRLKENELLQFKKELSTLTIK